MTTEAVQRQAPANRMLSISTRHLGERSIPLHKDIEIAGKYDRDIKPQSQQLVKTLKLNLGCGERHLDGYVNVDKYGRPDLLHDLETFPWPWGDNTVDQIQLIHVLEHLGQNTQVYLEIIKEMYRICQNGSSIRIVVPHHRHQFFFDDPTHVRAVTPMGMQLFSKSLNRMWIESGSANSPLGLYLDVDFNLKSVIFHPSTDWFRLHPERPVDTSLLVRESNIYNNLIEQIEMELEVIKGPVAT